MQLIKTLLLAVSVLVILAGISVIFGSTKQNKMNGLRFFFATLGAAVWTISIMVFLGLPLDATSVAPVIVTMIIGGITLCDICLLAYLGWQYRYGKAATIFFSLIGVGLILVLQFFPNVFYSEVILSNEINKIIITKGWYYVALIVYFFAISITFSSFLMKRIKATNNKGLKTGLKVFYVGLSIGGILALIFDLVLLSIAPNLIWIGPMATSISILSFYFSVVKFRVLSMTSKWMKVMSYLILIATGIILYILVFYAIFTALFRIPTPSSAVILLNIVMTVILLLLIPAINEGLMLLKTSVNYDKIQLAYIVKKLEKVEGKESNFRDIAKFLADNLHYSYVTMVINDRPYSSTNNKLAAIEIETINRMKPKCGIWVEIDRANAKLAASYDISKIACLIDKDGKQFGKIIFGKKLNKVEYSRIDMVEQEAIINLTGAIIEDGRR